LTQGLIRPGKVTGSNNLMTGS